MRFIAISIVVVLVSWGLAVGVFYHVSDGGDLYREITKGVFEEVSPSLRTVGDFHYMIDKGGDGASAQLDVFFGDIYLSKIEARADEEGFTLSWQHAYSAWPESDSGSDLDDVVGSSPLLVLSSGGRLFLHSKQVDFLIPEGAISPWLKMRLGEALDLAEIEVGAAALSNIATDLAGNVDSMLGLSSGRERFGMVAFALGPIQFATLWLFFVSLLMLIVGIWTDWAKDFGGKAADLLPYIGFFGTLLGMSNALQVLGRADLSDSLSKAVKLGPIGSQLSVAIETTKYALVLFVFASIVDMVINGWRARG